MPVHPNSLANLTPFEHGNKASKGRPSAGLSLIEWYNIMSEWTRAQLETIEACPTTPAVQLAAANRWLRAIDDDASLSAIEDRTEGKPKQRVDVSAEHVLRTPADRANAAADARARLRSLIDPSNN